MNRKISDPDEPVILPIDGTLDLYGFRLAEVKDLMPDYLQECRKMGIFQVRIIHGKGTGTLRRTVHTALARLEHVTAFKINGKHGAWGLGIF